MSREAHVYLQEEIDQRLFDRWDVDFNGFISHEEVSGEFFTLIKVSFLFTLHRQLDS